MYNNVENMTEELNARVRELERITTEHGQKIKGHEALCAERYQNIHKTLSTIDDRLKNISPLKLIGTFSAILVAFGVLIKLLGYV